MNITYPGKRSGASRCLGKAVSFPLLPEYFRIDLSNRGNAFSSSGREEKKQRTIPRFEIARASRKYLHGMTGRRIRDANLKPARSILAGRLEPAH